MNDNPSSGKPVIICDDWQAGENIQIGSDVIIECRSARIDNNVRIGLREDTDFRRSSGLRIKVDELILGDGVILESAVLLGGGLFRFDKGIRICAGSSIKVKDSIHMQPYGSVNQDCEISGVDIEIGRYLWMLPFTKIGGGSAFEILSKLRIGHFGHLGMYSFINTARAVELGDEVGLGTRTSLYTHGAYPSILEGFPVAFGGIRIGDRSWLPGSTVNPGVTIGEDCVIGVGSVVTRDIPAGALAAGIPARVIKEKAFPRELTGEEKYAIMIDILQVFGEICQDRHRVDSFDTTEDTAILKLDGGDNLIAYSLLVKQPWLQSLQKEGKRTICLGHDYQDWPSGSTLPTGVTLINLDNRTILGEADALSERLLNQLRRYGVRFRFSPEQGKYVSW